jgi:hypothetical protein
VEIKKEIQSKKRNKDLVTHHNILQEIRRFEKNMRSRELYDPLTVSQLGSKRHSSSNILKIEELVKVTSNLSLGLGRENKEKRPELQRI